MRHCTKHADSRWWCAACRRARPTEAVLGRPRPTRPTESSDSSGAVFGSTLNPTAPFFDDLPRSPSCDASARNGTAPGGGDCAVGPDTRHTAYTSANHGNHDGGHCNPDSGTPAGEHDHGASTGGGFDSGGFDSGGM